MQVVSLSLMDADAEALRSIGFMETPARPIRRFASSASAPGCFLSFTKHIEQLSQRVEGLHRRHRVELEFAELGNSGVFEILGKERHLGG